MQGTWGVPHRSRPGGRDAARAHGKTGGEVCPSDEDKKIRPGKRQSVGTLFGLVERFEHCSFSHFCFCFFFGGGAEVQPNFETNPNSTWLLCSF